MTRYIVYNADRKMYIGYNNECGHYLTPELMSASMNIGGVSWGYIEIALRDTHNYNDLIKDNYELHKINIELLETTEVIKGEKL